MHKIKNVTKHCFVTGDVQGVFYRSNTYDHAKSLGLKGWVKNLHDGRVEALISGDEIKVQKLINWMHKGPSYSRVDNIEIIDEEYQNFDDFDIVY